MELIQGPHPLLSQAVKPFDLETMHPAPVVLDMLDILKQEQGLGLSANQVGFPFQIFIMRTNKNKTHGDITTVINPVIKGMSNEKEKGLEGCLSYPDLFLKVNRPVSVIVEFDTLTSDMKSVIHVEEKFDGLDARVFLHEYDHLHGIQYMNRVSKLTYDMAVRKRKKLRRQAVG
jgi:peptide deformylase